jgi:hypothetical protein
MVTGMLEVVTRHSPLYGRVLTLWVMGHIKRVSYDVKPTSHQEVGYLLGRYKNIKRQQNM